MMVSIQLDFFESLLEFKVLGDRILTESLDLTRGI